MCSLLLTVALSAWLTVNMAFVGRDVSVPEVAGATPLEAKDILERSGLRLLVEEERHSEREAPGVIFYQQPLPGATTKKGRTVRVIVSLGPKTMRIPRVGGREFQDATTMLQAAGLHLGEVSYIHSLDIPEDHVIAQEPPGGYQAGRTDRVDLLVSRGPRRWRFVMPDLVGHPQEIVEDVLHSYGFRIGSVETEYVMGTRGGVVIGQYPPAGSEVFQGAAISLRVSRDVGIGERDRVRSEDILTF